MPRLRCYLIFFFRKGKIENKTHLFFGESEVRELSKKASPIQSQISPYSLSFACFFFVGGGGGFFFFFFGGGGGGILLIHSMNCFHNCWQVQVHFHHLILK